MDRELLRKMHESVENIRTADRPPEGDSWIDYATRHQHVGARPCWQCAARERALAEHRELTNRVDKLVSLLAECDIFLRVHANPKNSLKHDVRALVDSYQKAEDERRGQEGS